MPFLTEALAAHTGRCGGTARLSERAIGLRDTQNSQRPLSRAGRDCPDFS